MNETDSVLIRRMIVREFNQDKLNAVEALRLMRAVEDVTVKSDKANEPKEA